MNKWQTASAWVCISTDLLLDSENDDVVALAATDMAKRFDSLLKSETRPTTGSDSPSEIFLDDTGVNTFAFMDHENDPKQQYFKVSIPVNIAELEANEANTKKYVNLAEHRVKYLVQAWLEGAKAVREARRLEDAA